MDNDWQREFGKMIEQNYLPEEIPDPNVGLSLKDITITLSYLNELSLCLSLFISRYLDNPETEFPDKLVTPLFAIGAAAEELIEGLSIYEEDDD